MDFKAKLLYRFTNIKEREGKEKESDTAAPRAAKSLIQLRVT